MLCLSPIRKVIRSKVYWLSCSKCVNCNINRQNAWIFRLEQEYRKSKTAIFTTLTYANENVPQTVNKDTGEIINSLRYTDVQLFMKRLRKAHPNVKLKHYSVGEYGDETQRPHYHQIIYNASQNKIQENWQLGHTKIGTVTTASIRYVTKYMGKRIANTPEGAELPKSVMSQGLGKDYLTSENVKHHKENLIDSILLDDGKRIQLPTYYKDKIFDKDDKFKLKIINECRSDADLQHLWNRCSTWEKLDFEIMSRIEERHNMAMHNERLKQKQSKSLDT